MSADGTSWTLATRRGWRKAVRRTLRGLARQLRRSRKAVAFRGLVRS